MTRDQIIAETSPNEIAMIATFIAAARLGAMGPFSDVDEPGIRKRIVGQALVTAVDILAGAQEMTTAAAAALEAAETERDDARGMAARGEPVGEAHPVEPAPEAAPEPPLEPEIGAASAAADPFPEGGTEEAGITEALVGADPGISRLGHHGA